MAKLSSRCYYWDRKHILPKDSQTGPCVVLQKSVSLEKVIRTTLEPAELLVFQISSHVFSVTSVFVQKNYCSCVRVFFRHDYSGWRYGSRSNQQILLGCDWKTAGMYANLKCMDIWHTVYGNKNMGIINKLEHPISRIATY